MPAGSIQIRYLTPTSTLGQNPQKSMLSKPSLFNTPSATSQSLPLENYLQPTLGHGLRVWWAYYWPTFLISAVMLGTLTWLLRKGWENLILSTPVVLWSNRILPYAVTYGVSIFMLRYVLGKSFRSFRIVLLPRDRVSGTEGLPRSIGRTMRVWWAFCWRSVVLSLIVRFAGGVALGFTVGILSSVSRVMAVLAPIMLQIGIDGAVGLFVMYSAILDEEFSDFRVSLIPREAALGVAAEAQGGSLA